MFIRELSAKLIDLLDREDLFARKLKQDINNGAVFFAIRNERVDFYHQGGRLFSYDGKFKTHIKFASVCRLGEEKNYVTQEELATTLKCDFKEDYERIKENCATFSEQEAKGVSRVYGQYSYAKVRSSALVLDIEVSFKSDEDGRTQDRIDLLLLNDGILQFYEVKHFSNSAIWAKLGSMPKVVDQISRYKKQIENNEMNIIKQYQNYVRIVNEVFDLNIGMPRVVDKKVPLLIFGFDRDQLRGRFKTLFEGNLKGKISYYSIGEISQIKINNMWNACNS